jgi:hypothetical protein
VIPYATLLEQLGIIEIRELEDTVRPHAPRHGGRGS